MEIQHPNPSTKHQSKELAGLDGLRALACLWVFGHHLALSLVHIDSARNYSGSILVRFFSEKGNSGVAVFLILSGFLLSGPFWEALVAAKPQPQIGPYLIRRFIRIWPGFAICSFTCALLEAHHGDWFARLILSLTFTNWLNPQYFLVWQMNSPLWSVPMEWVCYLILPPLMYLGSRLTTKSVKIIFLSLVASILVIAQIFIVILGATIDFDSNDGRLIRINWEWFIHKGPIAMIPIFLVGVLSRGFFIRGQDSKSDSSKRSSLAHDIGCAISFLIAIFSLFPNAIALLLPRLELPQHMGSLYVASVPYFFPWFTFAMGVFIFHCPKSKIFGPILNIGVLRYLGRISYGFYLWHYPILGFVEKALNRTHWGASVYEQYLALAVIGFGLTLLAGDLSWRFVEKPLIRLVKNR